MKNTKWYQDAIIYQIYPRSFKDSNNDGMGDIKGIISKLDYLKDLGINCVWLSPVYKSPQEDNGYDISDYYNIDPLFGDMDDFKKMVKEMHKRGIRLIMDLVMNHTSCEHMWFQDALNNKDSKYRDYYFIRKGKGKNQKRPPNNWTGFFGEGAWEFNEKLDAYYLHLFAKGQPDVNWDNEEVRKEFKAIMKFWLDLGVDGFRCDVINIISKDQRLLDGKQLLILKGGNYYIGGPRLHEFLHEINKDVLSNYDCMTVGETVMSSLDDMKKLTDESREELSMIFNFDHTSVDNFFGVKWLMRKFSLRRFKRILGHYQQEMQHIGWNSLFYENHDQRRSIGRFNTSDKKEYSTISAKMLATAIYCLKGTPFIYQGQEIGMTNIKFSSIDQYQDVETHNIYKTMHNLHLPKWYIRKSILNGSRDNARTPMQWDNSKYAGFSEATPWLSVNPNKDQINVEASLNDEESIYHFYKEFIEFRKNEPLIKEGIYKDLAPRSSKLFAYERAGENEKLIILCNFSKNELVVPFMKNIKDYNVCINNYKTFENGRLLPYQGVVLKLKK